MSKLNFLALNPVERVGGLRRTHFSSRVAKYPADADAAEYFLLCGIVLIPAIKGQDGL
jgi:hypothetical protein